MVYYIIKLALEIKLDLQNPFKQLKMWIFEKWKIIVFGQNYEFFLPKGGGGHFWKLFFQILQ